MMYKTKSELYEEIKELMTEDEFEAEIKKRDKACGGLLTEDAISYLIVDELCTGYNYLQDPRWR
jgi:hypothetical protein